MAMTDRPNQRAASRRRTNAIIGAVFLLVVGGVVTVLIVLRNQARRTVACEMFYDGTPQLENGLPIYYQKSPVGEVTDVAKRPVERLQVIAYRPIRAERRGVATLGAGEHAQLLIRMADGTGRPDTLRIRYAGDTVFLDVGGRELARILTGTALDPLWRLIPAQQHGKTIAVNSLPLGWLDADENARRTGYGLREGQTIGIGDVALIWHAPGLFTRVRGEVNIADLIADGDTLTAPLVGAQASLATGMTISRPGITLTLAPVDTHGDLFVLGPGERRVAELVPDRSTDIAATIDEIGSYLTSSRRAYEPPHNRLERIVEDLNLSVANASAITEDIHDISTDIGGPASGADPARTRIGRSVDVLRKTIDSVRGVIAGFGGVGGKVHLMLDSVNGATLPRVNAIMLDVADAADNANILLQKLTQLSERIRTATLPKAEGAVDQLSPELRDALQEIQVAVHALKQAVGKINGALP